MEDHRVRMKRNIKYSVNGWVNLILHNHQQLILQEIWTPQMSAGSSAQQRGGRLGGSWNVWKKSLTQMVNEPTGGMCPARPVCKQRMAGGGMWCSKIIDQWPWKDGLFNWCWSKEEGQKTPPPWSFRAQTLACSGHSLREFFGKQPFIAKGSRNVLFGRKT